MDVLERRGLTRRSVLVGSGALVVSFSSVSNALAQAAAAPAAPEPIELPGSLNDARTLDSWIRIDAEGSITVFSGKAELGQGIRTALTQVAAEELGVEFADINLITADTGRSPDEGFTAGSQSMQNSGTAIRNAAAQTREILIAEAARRLGVPPEGLRVQGKTIITQDGQSVGFGELVSDQLLHIEAQPESKLTETGSFRIMGKSFQRVDIPAKVTGGAAFVHDMRLEGMLHARMVRPPSPNATLANLDSSSVEAMPGVVGIVRDGSFLAVVAEREFQAVKAMRALAGLAQWEDQPSLPDQHDLPTFLQNTQGDIGTVAEEGTAPAPTEELPFHATFTRPYQIHGSIGPSCAVALMNGDDLIVWSHTQGVYPDREAIGEMLAMPVENIRVVHVEGSGCYGHNGADDAAADAAMVARAMPGRPIRLLWMREQEHAWEPYGPAMLMKIGAALGPDGKITDWSYDLWSNIHSTRPGGAASLLAARQRENAITVPPPRFNISQSGNGDRNSNPLYVFPNKRVLWHFVPEMPLRVSALRALGAYANVFAIESFLDDLAIEANADPVEFRLRHMEDQRARDVIERTAEAFGWGSAPPQGRGHGFAFAKYKNLASYLALALEVEINRETGGVRVVRAVSAIDAGEVVNPDGIRNQTEGGILQAISWTLYEQVTFDDTRVTSIDWASYPIMRFDAVPDVVEVHVIDRPGESFLGAGEAAQGPVAAALGNAIRHAAGQRLYDLPFTRDRVKAAIGV